MKPLRWTFAAAFWAAGVLSFVAAYRLPMEAGGLFLGPILLGIGTFFVLGGLWFVVPHRPPVRREPVRLDSPRMVAIAGGLGVLLLLRFLTGS